MQASDDLTLRAFFNALAQLEPPLDGQIQHELNQIAPTLQQDEATAAKNLRLIVQKYHPLHELYGSARKELQKSHHTQPRNKFAALLELDNETSVHNNFSETVSLDLVQSLYKALTASQISEAVDIAKHFARLSSVYQHAVDVLEHSDSAWNWLQRSNPALGDTVPLDLLDTDEGAAQVDTILGRIDYGVYS
jgi:Protein of unknown function (DUF2384)